MKHLPKFFEDLNDLEYRTIKAGLSTADKDALSAAINAGHPREVIRALQKIKEGIRYTAEEGAQIKQGNESSSVQERLAQPAVIDGLVTEWRAFDEGIKRFAKYIEPRISLARLEQAVQR